MPTETAVQKFHMCAFALMTLLAASCASSAAAQDDSNHKSRKGENGWKVSVISAVLPDKLEGKARVMIEQDALVCLSRDVAILEIPLNAITRINRDDSKTYPVANFFMGAATAPSTERHRFASREYRQEMAGRAVLVGFSFLGLLFPRHKDVLLISWVDDSGEHVAEFHMGHAQGRAMLRQLRDATGVEPRDLEKLRRDADRRAKELQRWREKTLKPLRTDQGPLTEPPAHSPLLFLNP